MATRNDPALADGVPRAGGFWPRVPSRCALFAMAASIIVRCSVLHASQPHPAVARIIVPEASATSYGTGTLIDVRDQYGLVVTNWHVVRDGTAPPEVVFPNGFRSKARPLKLDSNWDLAALVIWRPPIEPVSISRQPPRPGDRLSICGYGQGDYREAAGTCTQYYAPRVDYPHELLELNVEARQGDSGGPIFNDRGELAGVLFGAGRGTTMGSYGGRVHSFLASLAPDIGQPVPNQIQIAQASPSPPSAAASPRAGVGSNAHPSQQRLATLLPPEAVTDVDQLAHSAARGEFGVGWPQREAATVDPWTSPMQAVTSAASSVASNESAATGGPPLASFPSTSLVGDGVAPRDEAGSSLLAQFTTVLAIIGAIALVVQFAKLATR